MGCYCRSYLIIHGPRLPLYAQTATRDVIYSTYMFPTHMEWNSFLEGNIIKSLTHDILCFAGAYRRTNESIMSFI